MGIDNQSSFRKILLASLAALPILGLLGPQLHSDEPKDAVQSNADQLVTQGRQIFRFDTFGDQAFSGGTLKLHQAVEGSALGGVGSGVIMKSKRVSPRECLEYALSQPTSVVITGIDSQEVLDQAIEIGSTFRPLTPQQISTILGKTAEAAAAGEYELFKTSSHFDSTAKHPEWLGSESANVLQLSGES